MKCLDCKYVNIIECGGKGFIGETVVKCRICNEITDEMEDCEDFTVVQNNENIKENIKMNGIIKKEIKTVKDLKEILHNFNDKLFFNVGTEKLGFEIDGYGSDCLSFGLISTDLENYLKLGEHSKIELNTYVIYVDVEDNKREEYYYEANSIEEALGKFFMDNTCLSYDDIIDHMEI